MSATGKAIGTVILCMAMASPLAATPATLGARAKPAPKGGVYFGGWEEMSGVDVATV
jgi:hypothetical protein